MKVCLQPSLRELFRAGSYLSLLPRRRPCHRRSIFLSSLLFSSLLFSSLLFSLLFSSLLFSLSVFSESSADLFKRRCYRRDSREDGERKRVKAFLGQKYGDEFKRTLLEVA